MLRTGELIYRPGATFGDLRERIWLGRMRPGVDWAYMALMVRIRRFRRNLRQKELENALLKDRGEMLSAGQIGRAGEITTYQRPRGGYQNPPPKTPTFGKK